MLTPDSDAAMLETVVENESAYRGNIGRDEFCIAFWRQADGQVLGNVITLIADALRWAGEDAAPRAVAKVTRVTP